MRNDIMAFIAACLTASLIWLLLSSVALVHQKPSVSHGTSRTTNPCRDDPFQLAASGNSGNEDSLAHPTGFRISDEDDAKVSLRITGVLLREQILSLLRVATAVIVLLVVLMPTVEWPLKKRPISHCLRVTAIASIVGFLGGRSESLVLSSFGLPTTAELQSRVDVHVASPSLPNEQGKPTEQAARTTTAVQLSRTALKVENPPLVRVGLTVLLAAFFFSLLAIEPAS